LLIEDTTHHDSPIGIELKYDVRQFTVRGNRLYNIAGVGIGGNMHESTTGGEILFNLAQTGLALDINQDGMAGPIFISRNTLVGSVRVRNTDASDGPFLFTGNVIVNDDVSQGPKGSGLVFSEVSDPSRIRFTDNLVGRPKDRIVSPTGELAGSSVSHLGKSGYQIAGRTAK
jgi:hypothetical protein